MLVVRETTGCGVTPAFVEIGVVFVTRGGSDIAAASCSRNFGHLISFFLVIIRCFAAIHQTIGDMLSTRPIFGTPECLRNSHPLYYSKNLVLEGLQVIQVGTIGI